MEKEREKLHRFGPNLPLAEAGISENEKNLRVLKNQKFILK
jgi:hypothetical protein